MSIGAVLDISVCTKSLAMFFHRHSAYGSKPISRRRIPMRAALMQRGRIWVDTVPDPVPQTGEVLVKTRACGICGSDLHAARHTDAFVATSREAGGAFKLTTFEPVVLGHEFSAEIVDYGPATPHDVAVGTVVCSVPMLARTQPLAVGYSAEIPGGFGEYMVLSRSLLLPVPNGTPDTHAALTEPMAVGLHAVNKARLTGREAILVLGCGPVGLAIITVLSQRGVALIVAADFSPRRRELAIGQGAHVALDPRETSAFDSPEIKRGDDVVIFECIGVPGSIDKIFLAAPHDARIVVVGVCLEMDHSRPLIAINKELAVQYVLGYSLDEFRQTLHNIADGSFDVAPLITARVGLDQVATSFELLRDPEQHAKILVEPWRA
jgi:threonine dehydrogenase-like Zn-dependent dehydrogenase